MRRGTTCAPCLLDLQCCDAFLYGLSLGPYIFQVRLAGVDLAPQLAQVSFQLGNSFCPADESPFKTLPVRGMAAGALAGAVFVLATLAGTASVFAALTRMAYMLAVTVTVTAATLALASTFAAALISSAAVAVMPPVFTHGVYPPL
jgi:hypothetical protein